jgi:hypothetical protein
MSEHVQSNAPHGHAHVQAGHDHGHGPHHESPYTPAQWKEFQKSDIGAGGAVVVLMTAIFCIGLMLYTVIAIVVAN